MLLKATEVIKKDCFMARIDLSDSYYSVSLAICKMKDERFQFEG